ncbi:hypothetical protein [Haloarcula amylovorans]|uniref:hypothetical protein n=1 Tax=Haloarcula amylovorans TaxID=2562280 RepID=UPI0010764083|nr:hypothetical protein [Halomicroarcula amylolytica]
MTITLDQVELPNGATVRTGSTIVVLSTLTQFRGNPGLGTEREVNEILVAEGRKTDLDGEVLISFEQSQKPLPQIRLKQLAYGVENGEIVLGEK